MVSEKLLFYGGSFDPPHLGHRKLLESAVKVIQPELVLVIPSGISPHKRKSTTPFGERVNMCRLAFSDIENVKISTIEGKGSKSYTVKTIRYLKKRYPGKKLYMLIGSDMLTTLDRWFLYRRIISSVTVVAGCRDDEDLDAVQEAADVLRKEGAEIILLSFEPVETSSSKVRRMDPKECAEQGMISDVVADYIIKRKLYQK